MKVRKAILLITVFIIICLALSFISNSVNTRSNNISKSDAFDLVRNQNKEVEIKKIVHIDNFENIVIIFYEDKDGLRHYRFKKEDNSWSCLGGSSNVFFSNGNNYTIGMENDPLNSMLIYFGLVKDSSITSVKIKQNGQEGQAKIQSGNFWSIIFKKLEPPKDGKKDVLKVDYYSGEKLVNTEGYNY